MLRMRRIMPPATLLVLLDTMEPGDAQPLARPDVENRFQYRASGNHQIRTLMAERRSLYNSVMDLTARIRTSAATR